MTIEMLQSIKLFAPEWILLAGLCFLFILDSIFPSSRYSKLPLWVVLFTCVLGGLISIGVIPESATPLFSGALVSDGMTGFFRVLFFFASAACAVLAYNTNEVTPDARTEFSLLLLCVVFGLCLMASATNLLTLYIGIETTSIVSFVMAGLKRADLRSNEASLKYLVFGAVASAVMVYGFSLVYGVTGSLSYGEISKYLAQSAGEPKLAIFLSVVMIYAGLAYKISAFPLHFWTPDVYEGAPTPVTTFFSIAPKAAGFAATIRFFFDVLSSPAEGGGWKAFSLGQGAWTQAIAVLSLLTMLVGNLSAIGQKNVKRILAYSSVAHVGYLLMGLISVNSFGLSAVLFYLLAYCLMNLGAFWVVGVVADRKKSEDLDAFNGLGWEDPLVGVCMAVFLFSLTGIPLFSGFIGKFFIFSSVIQTPGYLWLAIAGVLNSVVSLYYYATILRAMWFEKPATASSRPPESLTHRVALVGLALPTVVLGIYFEPAIRLVTKLVLSFR